jgi:CBS domain-containing protein
MLVKDIMVKNVKSINYDKTVFDACMKFTEDNISSLVVVNNGLIVGIITERDIIKRVVINEKNPTTTTIEEIMSKNIITIHASAKIEQATELMKKHNIKKLPVLLNNEFVGIISITDLANNMATFNKKNKENKPLYAVITSESY